MRCIVEFSRVDGDGHVELIETVRLQVPVASDAKTLASAMLKHTIIRGRIADVAVIKSMHGRIMDTVDRDGPGCESPHKSTILVE